MAPKRAERKLLLSALIKKNDNNGFKGERPGVGATGYVGSLPTPGDAHSLQRPEVASSLWVGVYQLFGSGWCRQGIAHRT